MVFAGDQWLQMPVRDLYDTQMMAMSIQAAKDMYDKGQKRIDDFYEKYGDFTSPIQKDVDWYHQNVTGKVSNFVNQLYQKGIDPLRSQEGRQAVAQLVRSIPVGDIAKVKQSAAAANEYLKNKGILEAAGKWDPQFELFANGGRSIDNWDTVNGSGVWNRTSPAEVKTLKELTESWYNNRTAHALDKAGVESFGMKYDPRYDYVGWTNKDALDIAAGQTPGWNGSIYSKYYRELAKQKLQAAGVKDVTPEMVEKQLQKDIATANREYLIAPSMSINQLYLQQLKNSMARGLASLKQQLTQDAPTTFMDRLQRNMNVNFENKNFGADSQANTFASFVKYWDDMAKKVENKGRKIGQHVEKTGKYETRTRTVSYGPTGMPYTKTERVPVEKTVVDYDQSNNGYYRKYTRERDRWTRFAQSGGRDYQVSMYDKSKEAAVARKLLKKDPSKFTAQEANFLQTFMQKDIMDTWHMVNSNAPRHLGNKGQTPGTTSTENLKKFSSAYWDNFRSEGLQQLPTKQLSRVFDNTTDGQKDPDLSNEPRVVRFGSGYSYAPIRQSKIAGPGRFKHNDVHSKFDRWLRANGNYGIHLDYNDVTAAGIPYKGRAGYQLDVLAHPAITKEQFMEFYNKAGGSKLGTPEKVAQKLGLNVKNMKLSYRGKDNVMHETDTYYEVPVIRTVDNLSDYNFRDINVDYEKMELGSSAADKDLINSENQSVMNGMPLGEAYNLLFD